MRTKAAVDLKFRRRQEGITNYKKRLAYVKSGLDRVTVRKTNSRILGQIARYGERGDLIVASADSAELTKTYKWPSRSNRTTAYLTGLLLASKSKEKGKELILDIGLSSPIKDSIPFVFAKGCIDGGLKILGNIQVDEKSYDVSRIVKYAEALGKGQAGSKHFSGYSKESKIEALPALFKEVKAKLTSG
jgi:large subunit ribosomal protein L18